MKSGQKETLNPAAKKWVGLGIGATAGVIFSLVTWGIDSVILAASHAYLPWLQLVIGSMITLLLSAICGLICTMASKTWFTVLTWFGWGVFEIYLCSTLPFRPLERLITTINPLLAGEISYTPLQNPAGRLFVAAIVGFVCCLFITLLFHNTLNQVWAGMYVGISIFSLGIWLIFFIIFGFTLDNLYHFSSRNAIAVTNRAIQTAVEHPEYFNDPQLRSKNHISGFVKQQSWIGRKSTIVIKSYDKLMDTFVVIVDFDGYWTTCYEAYNSITICK